MLKFTIVRLKKRFESLELRGLIRFWEKGGQSLATTRSAGCDLQAISTCTSILNNMPWPRRRCRDPRRPGTEWTFTAGYRICETAPSAMSTIVFSSFIWELRRYGFLDKRIISSSSASTHWGMAPGVPCGFAIYALRRTHGIQILIGS